MAAVLRMRSHPFDCNCHRFFKVKCLPRFQHRKSVFLVQEIRGTDEDSIDVVACDEFAKIRSQKIGAAFLPDRVEAGLVRVSRCDDA